jgi:CRISP-associated protein Cas1
MIMIFVIDRHESTLRYQGGCLLLQRKGKKDRQVPIRPLEQVVVYGNALVEAAVFRVLGEAGVPVVMLATRGKQQAAILGGGLATQLPLRRLQHRLADNPVTSLALAKWFVSRKAKSYDLVLTGLGQLHEDGQEDRDEFKQLRDRSDEKIQIASSFASIMGFEGQLAHAWFALLAKHLPYKWKFVGRNRRPPRDPVNALLSLGYTLLLSEVRRGMQLSGFDPSLGFLHRDYPGRESLALDFAEIFRSGVDNFVLHWLHSGEVNSNGFYYREKEGCRLSKAARPLFFQSWAQYREHWPRPLGPMAENSTVHFGSLREMINGQVAQAREYMKILEEQHGFVATRKSHGAEDTGRELA